MKVICSVLVFLVFINAVYSAAMREGSEDLLRFLKDAFEMNLPPDHIKPTKPTETALETEKTLNVADPTEECKAPEHVTNLAELFITTPTPNLIETTGIAEERSIERNSNLESELTERTSAEDSREVESYKRLQLRAKLSDTQVMLQEHNRGSAESSSVDRTEMDTEVTKGINQHLSKATDVSSEEMDKIEENVRPRSLKMMETYSAEAAGAPTRQELDIKREIHPIMHSLAGQIHLKDQTRRPHDKHQQDTYKRAGNLDSPEVMDTPDSQNLDTGSEEVGYGRGRVARQTVLDQSSKTTLLSDNQTNRSIDKDKSSLITANLNDSTNMKNSSQVTVDNRSDDVDQKTACVKTSVQHPREENNSLDAPNVDQKIQKDTMSYQNQLRKICPSKRVRTSSYPREQLDLDSPERVNSELLDNSSERLEEHVSVTV